MFTTNSAKYRIYYGWDGWKSTHPLCFVNEGLDRAIQRMAKDVHIMWDANLKQNAWLVVDAVNHVKLIGIWTVGHGRPKYLECQTCEFIQPHPPQHASQAVCALCGDRLDPDQKVEAAYHKHPAEFQLYFNGRFYSLYWTSLPDAITEAKEKIRDYMGCCPLDAQGAIVSIRDDGRFVLEQIITSEGATGLICCSCGAEYPNNQLTRDCPWCGSFQPVTCYLGSTFTSSWPIYWLAKDSPKG